MTKKTKLAHGVDTLPATDESMFNDLQTIRQEETPKKKTKVTKKVIVIRNLEKEGGSTIGHIAQEETPKKEPKVTKKVIVIRNLEKEGGSTIGHIAQEIVDLGMDSDLEKNKRVVRLWISKIGFKVDSRKEKESGARYYFKAK
jgi:hypothetical protein